MGGNRRIASAAFGDFAQAEVGMRHIECATLLLHGSERSQIVLRVVPQIAGMLVVPECALSDVQVHRIVGEGSLDDMIEAATKVLQYHPASLTMSAGEQRAFGKPGTAVDDDGFAGDVARLIAREEHHRAGDLLRAAETFGRDEVGNPFGSEAGLQA
jgi:hypothetical protein